MSTHYLPGTQTISNNNNLVGINTLNPNYTLDVNGSINFTNQLLKNGSSFLGQTGPQGSTGPQGNIGFSTGQVLYMNKTEISDITPYSVLNSIINISTGANTTVSGAGIQQFTGGFLSPTGVPGITSIQGGNWNFEVYASMNSNGGIPDLFSNIYIKTSTGSEKLIASNSSVPCPVTEGIVKQIYLYSIPVPQTTISVTDRILIKNYASNLGGRDMTIYFQDTYNSQIVTTLAAAVGIQGPTGSQGPTGPSNNVYQEGPVINISTSTLDNYLLSGETFFIMTGAAAPCTISGFQNGINGRFITLINNSASTITFANESTSSTPTNRFFIYPTSGVDIGIQGSISFIYVSNILTGRWIMTSNT